MPASPALSPRLPTPAGPLLAPASGVAGDAHRRSGGRPCAVRGLHPWALAASAPVSDPWGQAAGELSCFRPAPVKPGVTPSPGWGYSASPDFAHEVPLPHAGCAPPSPRPRPAVFPQRGTKAPGSRWPGRSLKPKPAVCGPTTASPWGCDARSSAPSQPRRSPRVAPPRTGLTELAGGTHDVSCACPGPRSPHLRFNNLLASPLGRAWRARSASAAARATRTLRSARGGTGLRDRDQDVPEGRTSRFNGLEDALCTPSGDHEILRSLLRQGQERGRSTNRHTSQLIQGSHSATRIRASGHRAVRAWRVSAVA